MSNAPVVMGSDASSKFFGTGAGLAWLPEGYEDALKPTEKAQSDALAVTTAALATSLARTATAPIAITNVRTFDALDGRFLDGQTVVVDKGIITAAGPSARVTVPANAERIDGAGKTLVPGLWDCHMHVGDDFTGLQELSMGVTSVRDRQQRHRCDRSRGARAKGQLLSPHVCIVVDRREGTVHRAGRQRRDQ